MERSGDFYNLYGMRIPFIKKLKEEGFEVSAENEEKYRSIICPEVSPFFLGEIYGNDKVLLYSKEGRYKDNKKLQRKFYDLEQIVKEF